MAYVEQSAVANGDFYTADARNQQIDNTIALEDSLCGSYTMATDHDHDAVNSKEAEELQSGAVKAGTLNTTEWGTSATSAAQVTASTTQNFSFIPMAFGAGATDTLDNSQSYVRPGGIDGQGSDYDPGTTMIANLAIRAVDGTITVAFPYIVASPPNRLGGLGTFPYWVWLLVNGSDILGAVSDCQPPWDGKYATVPHPTKAGQRWLPPKGHVARLAEYPRGIDVGPATPLPSAETVLVDVRAFAEVVDVPLSEEVNLEGHLSTAAEYIAQGADPAELAAVEADLRARLAWRRHRQTRARALLDNWEAWCEEQRKQILFDPKWGKSDALQARQYQLLASLPVAFERRHRRLEIAASRMPKIRAVEKEMKLRGQTVGPLAMGAVAPASPLQTEFAELCQATHELKPRDRKLLPSVPCPKHNNKPWHEVVKVLRRPSMT